MVMDMLQRDQVIQVMEKSGGASTLGKLNQEVDVREWGTDTPYATIRRIVQDTRYFFRIKPGLWALNSYRNQLGHLTHENKTFAEKEKLDHYYYQGLLLEMGNVQNFQTFIPNQDKNKTFLNTTLGQLRRLEKIPPFSYNNMVQYASTVDVIWFNHRNMPDRLFEVEHSTNFGNSLSKYVELQDFNVKFFVVAPEDKKKQYLKKIEREVYNPIRKRVNFMDYEELASRHSNSMEANRLGPMP